MATTLIHAFRQMLTVTGRGGSGGLYTDGRIYRFIRFHPSSSSTTTTTTTSPAAIQHAVELMTFINSSNECGESGEHNDDHGHDTAGPGSTGRGTTDDFNSASVTSSRPTSSHAPTKERRPAAFQTMMVDKDEITFMVCDDDWTRYQLSGKLEQQEQEQQQQGQQHNVEISPIEYRLITFDVALSPSLVGFMAAITKQLADADVSVLPFAAYSRDHIFVRVQDFDKAIVTLQRYATSEVQAATAAGTETDTHTTAHTDH
jgi:hypothetical protein